MARDIPSPCCGTFSITIKEELSSPEQEVVMYSCHCGECGAQYGDSADSRAEAIYNYDERCLKLWRKNPNGFQDWMKTKPKDKNDVLRRTKIYERMKKGFSSLY